MARIVAALVFLLMMLAQVARADDASCYAAGKAQCDKNVQQIQQGWPYAVLDSCTFRQADDITWVAIVRYHYGNQAPGSPGQDTPTFQCAAGDTPQPPPDNPCTSMPTTRGQFGGTYTQGMTICMTAPAGSGSVKCRMSFSVLSPTVQNEWGNANTYGQLSPTGQVCDGSSGDGGWSKPDGSPPPAPAPPPPDTNPPKPDPVPQTCAGASCYDPTHDQYCGTTGGVQVCVPGGPGRGFDNGGKPVPPSPGEPQGACASMGESTLCVGSPNAPQPPAPPKSPIADPPTSITNIDHYVQTNPVTGAKTPVTVTSYTNPGSSPIQSGQQGGDTGPAPASSSGGGHKGDGTTSTGGGDCNTPPVVMGSGGLNAVAYQTWKTRCAVEGNKLGTGTVNSLGDLYTPSTDTTASVVADFQAKVQQTPVATAVSGYFQVGTVGGSCPVWTLAATDWMPAMTFDFYCRGELSELLDMARLVVLITCAYVAFQIAMGDS